MTSRLLLCCDPGRTRLPNFPQPEYPGIRECFATIASRPEVALAYVSGRHRELAEQAARLGLTDILYIARGALPGMNGNYSAGVLDGLLHFFPQTAPWREQEEVLHHV
jgi:hypothetical protein